jgi:hypothetical protein
MKTSLQNLPKKKRDELRIIKDMFRKSKIILMILYFFALPATGQETINIIDAIEQGLIKTESIGNGLESVMLKIISLDTRTTAHVVVPVGTYFENKGDAQDMIVIKADTIHLKKALTITSSIVSVCANLDKEVPDSSSQFIIKDIPTHLELKKLFQFMKCTPKLGHSC